ncbi:MAG: UMP kinase [Candidatus Aenigmarchaeota archaeon]|nr:UMP kinase [Candidatus Aenigmarchaeota archaeon]
MKIVISLGGSVITSELTPERIKKYAEVFKKLKNEGHKLVVVCGGGKVAREYVEVAKGLTKNQGKLDMLAIFATYMNATLLIYALGNDAYPEVIKTSEDFMKAMGSGKIIVAGGHEPAHSSDTRASVFAELMEADLLINATTVDGIYDSNPEENPNAKKFEKLTYEELFELMKKQRFEACGYALFDLTAIKIIERAGIRMVVINGLDPEEIYRAVKGNHNGTVVS